MQSGDYIDPNKLDPRSSSTPDELTSELHKIAQHDHQPSVSDFVIGQEVVVRRGDDDGPEEVWKVLGESVDNDGIERVSVTSKTGNVIKSVRKSKLISWQKHVESVIVDDDEIKHEEVNLESELEVKEALSILSAEVTRIFENLLGNIEHYILAQTQVEAAVRTMLHSINSAHDESSQVERMALQLAVEIASQTISEDLNGVLPLTGHNKQFLNELEHLKNMYSVRSKEIVDDLEMAKTVSEPDKQVMILDNGIKMSIENGLRAMADVDRAIINILLKQKATLVASLEQFKALQYFQEEEAWQNPTIRLLIEYAQQVIETIDRQLASTEGGKNLKSQIDTDADIINDLLQKSSKLAKRIYEYDESVKQEAA